MSRGLGPTVLGKRKEEGGEKKSRAPFPGSNRREKGEKSISQGYSRGGKRQSPGPFPGNKKVRFKIPTEYHKPQGKKKKRGKRGKGFGPEERRKGTASWPKGGELGKKKGKKGDTASSAGGGGGAAVGQGGHSKEKRRGPPAFSQNEEKRTRWHSGE